MCLLRYPGGKQRVAKRIVDHLPKNIETLYSPFFGGGSVELEWLAQNPERRVIGRDIFEPLTNFWRHVIAEKGPQMAHYLEKNWFPLSKSQFKILQGRLRLGTYPDFKRACWFFAVNRSSFSGTTLSGGCGNGDRYTESALHRLTDFKPPKGLQVRKADVFDYLRRRVPRNDPKVGVFLDPPYLLKNSKLYGNNGDTHNGFDHARLCRQLTRLQTRWMVTYNDDKQIRELYKGNRFIPETWKYGMSADKSGSELFIFNYEASS